MISPSRFLAESLLMPPIGKVIADHNGRCVFCGGEYQSGEVVTPFVGDKTFQDYSSLANPSGSMLCGYCPITFHSKFSSISMKSIVFSEGVFPFGSNDAIAYWLLNPPPPPFMMVINNAQRAHVVWKSAVSHSREIFFVRCDDKTLKIRRPLLVEAVDAYRTVLAQIEAQGSKRRPIELARDMDTASHGQFSDFALRFFDENPSLQGAMKTLQSLGAGELWGLRNIVFAKNIEKPAVAIAPGQSF